MLNLFEKLKTSFSLSPQLLITVNLVEGNEFNHV